MRSKPVRRRASARRDLENAVDYYDLEAGPELARRFLRAAREAFAATGKLPGAGSPRLAETCDVAGLRCRPVRHFPYVVLYVERDRFVEILRVLHARSDIPKHLKADEWEG